MFVRIKHSRPNHVHVTVVKRVREDNSVRHQSRPACQQVGAIDLHTIDRRPGASNSGPIPSLSCQRHRTLRSQSSKC
jgi:hypothetical protein